MYTDGLSLLSFNVFMRPVIGMHTDMKSERIDPIALAIREYDIVCLQEIFSLGDGRRDTLMAKAREYGLEYHSIPPSPSIIDMLFKGKVVSAGLLTLSRYPILSSQFYPFYRGSGVDSLSGKGVLYSRLKVKGQTIHLFNVHLQANYSSEYSPTDHPHILARLGQIEETKAIIDGVINSDGRLYQDGPGNFKDIIIIAGDFNVNPKSSELPSRDFPEIKSLHHFKKKTFSEYEFLVSVLSRQGKDKLEDLAFNTLGYHPTTFGDVDISPKGTKTPKDKCLTNTADHLTEQRLDYIFWLIPQGTDPSLLSIHPGECKVIEFFVKDSRYEFTQLSDHYGLACKLNYR
jgi:endonuclease/exonuclease/phosphatase family metal-dependent hydrolase